jgi:hypothetical protein
MNLDPNDILIACCHIKKNFFFEDSLRRLFDAGFRRFWIQQTGTETFGSYGGPSQYYWPAPHTGICAWETGLKCLRRHTTEIDNWKYIFLADFDLFFLGTDEFIQFLGQAIGEEYDHVSRFKDRNEQDKYSFGESLIVEVPEITIGIADSVNDIPVISPHFATGHELYSKVLWDSYTDYDMGDGRRMYREAVNRGYKMGAQFANYGPGEQCWGKEWFHVSNLTYFYHMVDGTCPSTLDPDNHEHLWRMGFFAAQKEYYGPDIYPLEIGLRLKNLYNSMGGELRCLESWHQEIKGKPMEHWVRA